MKTGVISSTLCNLTEKTNMSPGEMWDVNLFLSICLANSSHHKLLGIECSTIVYHKFKYINK